LQHGHQAAALAVILITIEGTDVGELGEAPFHTLMPLLETGGSVELFIDARNARGPSIDVSVIGRAGCSPSLELAACELPAGRPIEPTS